ncbi:MAG: DUF4276 family protein [Thermoanaerobaculia bacterium]
MRAEHLEILVEEPSMELFLRELLPRLLREEATFNVHPSQGKDDLLRNLPARLRGYAAWLPESWRVVVVLDQDDQECHDLKRVMEMTVTEAGLRSRTFDGGANWQVVTRVAIEELEAWYFGDWEAVHEIYPRVPRTIPEKAPYRDPDKIRGGTWEAFERVLQKAGYFQSGLAKMEVARSVGSRMDVTRNRSHSFGVFRDALLEAVQQ